MGDEEQTRVDVRSRIAALNDKQIDKATAAPSRANIKVSSIATDTSNDDTDDRTNEEDQARHLDVKNILALYDKSESRARSDTKSETNPQSQPPPQLPPRIRSGVISRSDTGSSLGSDSAASLSYTVRKPAAGKQPEIPARPRTKISTFASDGDVSPAAPSPPPLPGRRGVRQSPSTSSLKSLPDAAPRSPQKSIRSPQKARTLAPPPLQTSVRRRFSTPTRQRRRDEREKMIFACEAQTKDRRRYEKLFDAAVQRQEGYSVKLTQITVAKIWQRSKLDSWFLLRVWQRALQDTRDADQCTGIDKPAFVRAMTAIDVELRRRQSANSA